MEDNTRNSGAPAPFKGQIGAPELGPFPGTAISLQHRHVLIRADTGFGSIDLDQTDGIVLALDWIRDGTHHIGGSAVMVAPGVALTAKHVIDGMRELGFLAEDGGYLMAYGFHAEGMMMMWNAVHVEQDPNGDLAILTLVRATAEPEWPLDKPLPVNAATIAAKMPATGETISLIGFRASEDFFVGSGSAANLVPAIAIV